MRIAIIGSGVSGLVTAHLLHGRHDVVLYESDERPGGHSHTHRVELPELTCDVDTGFLVYNERTYPLFCRLLDELGVATRPSDMSFSVADQRTGLEWRGTSFSTVFAQRRNLARPEFLRMLADVGRFNRLARGLLADPPPDSVTLEEVLAPHRWSAGFRDWYLVPLGSSIWSADPSTFTQIPAATFARFFERHGLLNVRDQPKWRTVDGGSKRYVDAILRPLRSRGPPPARDPGGQDPPRARRSRGGERGRGRNLRPRRARHPQRPGPVPPVGPRPDGARDARCACATSRTGPPCTPTPACCPPSAGPGPAGTTTASRPSRTRPR